MNPTTTVDHDLTPPTQARRAHRLGALAASAALHGLLGLVATPALAWGIGCALYHDRYGWSRDQGEGFVTTIFALLAAPCGGLAFAVLGPLCARLEPKRRRWTARALAAALWALVTAVSFGALVVAA